MKRKSLAGVLLTCALCCAVAAGMSGCGTTGSSHNSSASGSASSSSSPSAAVSSSNVTKTAAVADKDAAVKKAWPDGADPAEICHRVNELKTEKMGVFTIIDFQNIMYDENGRI